jgi:thiamine pyrophosphate-dependent acetolactate synthase large subunit-like protein
MHASMAVFNAYEDRQPMLIFGGNGPMDATQRRPWIDWVHTTHAQGELVREYTKWEHQPTSVAAIPEAILRAWQIAHIQPAGPVYIDLDAGLQEMKLTSEPRVLDPAAFPMPSAPAPSRELAREAAAWLVKAEFPVLLPGNVAGTQQNWDNLLALAEALAMPVLLERRGTGCFPTNHPLSLSGVGVRARQESRAVLRQADLVLALERNDPAGTLREALTPPGGTGRDERAELPWPRLINVSLEPMHVSSWVADYQELPRTDLPILAAVDSTLPLLLEEVRRALRDDQAAQRRAEQRIAAHRDSRAQLEAEWQASFQQVRSSLPVSVGRVVSELRDALGDDYRSAIMAYLPLSWPSGQWDFTQPGAYIGGDGGAGIGAGPGLTVGAALAAQGSGRPVIGIVGDGAMLMTPTALWTAAHYHLPALLLVVNNQSYYNDEEHQERVARTRGRPIENRWLGLRMTAPEVDFATMSRSLGVEGFGPITEPDAVRPALDGAVAALREGRPTLVEIRISPR